MLTRWIDSVLDSLHIVLRGCVRERNGNAEATAMIVAFALAILAFGFALTNPTLAVDVFSYLATPFRWDPFWIGRGSWGGLLVLYLTPGGWVTPIVPLVIGILLQLLTAVLVGWALGVGGLGVLPLALLYALFAAFPYFAAQMVFPFVQIAYPLATLLMVCAVLLAMAGDIRRGAAAVVAIGFALSIYQGSPSVLAPVALLAPLASRDSRGREIVIRYRRVLLAAAAGGVLFLAMHKALLALTGVTPQNPYYSASLDWRFWERSTLIRSEIGFLFFGAGDVIPVKALVVFLLAALMWVAYAVGRKRGALPRLRALAAAALVGALLVVAPFAMLFVHYGQLAPRSAVGLVVVWFALYASLLAARSPVVRRTGLAFLAVTIAMIVFHDNRMFYSQYLVTQADRIMMARIAERIDQLPLPREAGRIVVVVIGQYSHPEHDSMRRYTDSVLGYSQFEWGVGETRWYMRALALAIGVDHFSWHDPSELGGTFAQPGLLQDRQPWPHRSSVFAHDGYAVVWLGHRREEVRVAPLQAWFDSLRMVRTGG